MFLKFFLPAVALAQSRECKQYEDCVWCYVCDYSWVVAKVNGQEVTTPVRGDSKCRDGVDEKVWSLVQTFRKLQIKDFGEPVEFPREVSLENGLKYTTKCSTVEAKGTETIEYNGNQTYQVEFDVFVGFLKWLNLQWN